MKKTTTNLLWILSCVLILASIPPFFGELLDIGTFDRNRPLSLFAAIGLAIGCVLIKMLITNRSLQNLSVKPSKETRSNTSRWNRRMWIYAALLSLIVVCLVELCSWLGLSALSRFRGIKYQPLDVLTQRQTEILEQFLTHGSPFIELDPHLGWTIKKFGNTSLLRANAAGFRSNKDYSTTPQPGIFRALSFGDSFTLCVDVDNNETWQAVIEESDPSIEVLNFGVGGYGMDQAYLRYLKRNSQLGAEIIFIGFLTENIFRHVNSFRPFYVPGTGTPLAKPRFTVVDKRLTLLPNPLPSVEDYQRLLESPQHVLRQLGIHDYFFQTGSVSSRFDWSPTVRLIRQVTAQGSKSSTDAIISGGYYNSDSEAFEVTKKLFNAFYHQVLQNSQIPIIVIFPTIDDVTRFQQEHTSRHQPLTDYFKAMRYNYVDLVESFEEHDIQELFNGHLTPVGNRIVGELLLEQLNIHRGESQGSQ